MQGLIDLDLEMVHKAVRHSLAKRGFATLSHYIGVECHYRDGKDPLVVCIVSLALSGCRRIEASTFDEAIVLAMKKLDEIRLKRTD